MEWLSRHVVRLIIWLSRLCGGPGVPEIGTQQLQEWLRGSDSKVTSDQAVSETSTPGTSTFTQNDPQPVRSPLADGVSRLAGQQEQKIVLVDVRSESERAVSMLPGALTQAEFEDHAEGWPNCRIVVYCTIGVRSFLYARKLSKQGMPAVNYIDGILGWCQHKGQLVDKDGKPTNRVHLLTRLYQSRMVMYPLGQSVNSYPNFCRNVKSAVRNSKATQKEHSCHAMVSPVWEERCP